MKKATALFTALLFCLTFSLTVFADDIFIIEDGEDEFVPNVQTTTQPAETTTANSQFDNLIDSDKFSGYFDSIKDTLGNGLSSIMDGFGSWGVTGETTTSSQSSSGLPNINAGTYTPSNQSASMTTVPNKENNVPSDNSEVTTSADRYNNEEVPSVLIVNNSQDDSWGISGSTLTLLIFIVAIIILVLVVVIVLVVMTRRTEFDSAVKNRSTLPSVEQPNSLAQFFEDDIPDDGNDYSNITYWDE